MHWDESESAGLQKCPLILLALFAFVRSVVCHIRWHTCDHAIWHRIRQQIEREEPAGRASSFVYLLLLHSEDLEQSAGVPDNSNKSRPSN